MPTITPQPQPQSQSHPRSPSTTSDENNAVTWEHLEHAPPAPPSLPSQSANTTTHDNDGLSTADNHSLSERALGPEMHALSEAVHVEDVMAIPQGTGTVTGIGPGAGRAPAIRIHPPGDTVSTSVHGTSGVGGFGGSTKSASFSGR